MPRKIENPATAGDGAGLPHDQSPSAETGLDTTLLQIGQRRDDYTPVAQVPKNKRETICVGLRAFRGQRRKVDLRVFAVNADGVQVETAKCLVIRLDLVPDVARALWDAQVLAAQEAAASREDPGPRLRRRRADVDD